MAKKGQTFKKYSAEFKLCVILDMREHGLGYRETARKYNLGSCVSQGKNLIRDWERIYLTEGAEGFMVEAWTRLERQTEKETVTARSGK